MTRPRRQSLSPKASTPTPGAPRGITASDVDRAADSLLREGQRPTIEKVRAKIGRGSPNTINPLLDQWWSRLAGRLDAAPAALHRLPEPVLHAAEGFWLQTLDEARRRAQLESGSSRKAIARERQDLDLRSHILSIRESELRSRIEQSERRTGQLELEVESLTTLLRKEQASRAAAERRLNEWLASYAGGRSRAPQPTARAARGKGTRSRKAKSPKPARNASRRAPTPRRRVTPTQRKRR